MYELQTFGVAATKASSQVCCLHQSIIFSSRQEVAAALAIASVIDRVFSVL